MDFTIRYIPTATSCSQETALIRISSNDPSAHFVDLLASGTGRVPISQIIARIETGNQDPDRNTRVFLGFDGKHGREFRMRTTDDANPFRQSTALDIVFGSGANVRDEDINDPTEPQMDQNRITGAYIRIEPGQEKPWEIASAEIFINGSGTPMFSLKLPNISWKRMQERRYLLDNNQVQQNRRKIATTLISRYTFKRSVEEKFQ